MFSSEQILEISGDLSHDELKSDLEYALRKSGWYESFTRQEKPAECCFQITEDGRYCVGWGNEKGWEVYQFDFDVEVIAKIISNFLEKQTVEYGIFDGSYSKGYLMKVIGEYMGNEHDGIKEPFHGIVSFEPFTCFYSK